MSRNRYNGRRPQVSRKPEDEWAVLAVPAAKLDDRLTRKGISTREAASLAGHASHSHVWRLRKGKVATTSTHTADVLESITDSRGLLFARMTARSVDRAVA